MKFINRGNDNMRKSYLLALILAVFLAACGGQTIEETVPDDSAKETTETTPVSTEKEDVPDKQEEAEELENDTDNEESSDEKPETSKENEKEKEKDKSSRALAELKVHYINAGQADATLFQFVDQDKKYTILYDTGDWNKNDVVNYLATQDIPSIDLIIISHPHADHIGQLAQIVDTYDTDEVWMSGNTSSSGTFQQALEAVLESNAAYEEPRAGDVYDVGSMKIEVLHPSKLTGKLNEDSISLRFTYGDVSLMFTGDAYKNEELAMVSRDISVRADILQLGHHGSNTSSDPSFIKAVNPSVAIYSASSNNSYGHPSPEVVSLIQDAGITLYGTDVHGTILVTSDGKDFTIATKEDGTITPKSTGSANNQKKPKKKEAKKEEGSKKESSQKKPNTNCVDINKATFEELQKIIHIGPARADDVIDLRAFDKVEDLTRVSGLGPARIADITNEGKACVK